MEAAPENGKESSHSAHANGIIIIIIIIIYYSPTRVGHSRGHPVH
jgi:hypothetical protein